MSAPAVRIADCQPEGLDTAAVRARMARYDDAIAALRRSYPAPRGALLPLLWLVQQEFGWVPRAAIPWAAEQAGVAPVHAFAVVEFYTMFRQRPMGRYLIQVCHGMCCQLQGSEALIAHLERTLGIPCGGTTSDGIFSLVRVECLALCGTGPGVMIDDQAIGPEPHPLHGDLVEHHLDTEGFHPTPDILDRWIAFLRQEARRTTIPLRPDALGGFDLATAGHPGAPGATAEPLPPDYAPAAPAVQVTATIEAGNIVIAWRHDPARTVRAEVQRSDDRGTTWRTIATVGAKTQRATDPLPAGQTAFYRVICHEKRRSARPSMVVAITAPTTPDRDDPASGNA